MSTISHTDVASISSPALAEGQLRYLTSSATGIRILEVQPRSAVVCRIPGSTHFRLRALSELRQAPLMAPDGFRIRWLTGALDLVRDNEQELLSAILADERARGGDRIRIKVLDDYLAPIIDSEKLRERFITVLTMNDCWQSVGVGTDVGYVPVNTILDWHIRWERAALPLVGSPKSETEAVKNITDRIQSIDNYSLSCICNERWIHLETRKAALAELVTRWRKIDMHEDFYSISINTMQRILEVLATDKELDSLLKAAIDPVLSFSTREIVHRLLLSRNDCSVKHEVLQSASVMPNALVCSHWFRIWADSAEGIEFLALILLSIAPTNDEEGKRISKNIHDALIVLGIDAFSVLLSSCQRACELNGKKDNIAMWLYRIVPNKNNQILLDAIEGVATLYRLRDRRADEFTKLGLSQRRVQNGLICWLTEDVSEREQQLSPPDWTAAYVDKEWERAGRAITQRLCDIMKCEELADAIRDLINARISDRSKIDEITSIASSPDNALYVLNKKRAEDLRSDRTEIFRSVRSELENEKISERIKIAKFISEILTAIERVNESVPTEALSTIGTRIRELVTDLDLAVKGYVGERVLVDPTQHDTRIQERENGEIRRVGIIDTSGKILVRPYVTAIRRS